MHDIIYLNTKERVEGDLLMVQLENKYLTVNINAFGAEMSSVIDNESGYEFVWQADGEFWARHAPALFPIVGRLKEDQYTYNDETYHMTQHGFARDSEFEVEESSDSQATFVLRSNEESLEKYPFPFVLKVRYTLEERALAISYEVINPSTEEVMYYGIGGHPAFNVSQSMNDEGQQEFDQVHVTFEPAGEYPFIPLAETGLLALDQMVNKTVDDMSLTHDSFSGDAFVYEIEEDTVITLHDSNEKVSIRVSSENMTHVGIWSPYPKRAGFVCIEPWAGLADIESTSGKFDEKYAINELAPNGTNSHGYTIEFNKEI